MVKEIETKTNENEHKAGDIETIVDIVALKVWKNNKEAVIFPKEQENLAILSSEIFKISEKANEEE